MNSNNTWTNNRIPSNVSQKKSRHQWIFFLVLVGVSGFIIYDNQDDLLSHYHAGEYREMTELVVLLFPMLFLFTTIKKSMGRRRYGECYLIMDPFPAVIGQKFAGYVEVQDDISSLTLFAELRLSQKEWDYSDEDRRYTSRMIYKMPVEIIPERALVGIRLLLQADMPHDKPASSQGVVDNQYEWHLYVYSQNKAFKRRWFIPVNAADDFVH